MSIAYATLAQRVNAATLDAAAIITGFIAVPLALGPTTATPALMFFVLFLAEPTSIRLFGCTPGQALLGLRVRPSVGARLGLPRLVLRYLTKLTLGGISIAYILFNRDHQAIHDRTFGTHVISLKGEDASEPEAVGLPGPWRRFGVALLWCALIGLPITLALTALVMLLLGPIFPEILEESNEAARLIDAMSSIIFVCVSLWLLELGASGRLLGARRRLTQGPQPVVGEKGGAEQ